jgi:hypothetical protein
MYRILLIVIALIVYGPLYPWDFHPTQLAASPVWVLIHSWPDQTDWFLFRDIPVNVVIYMPLGVFGLLALPQKFHTPFAVTIGIIEQHRDDSCASPRIRGFTSFSNHSSST